MTLYEIDAKIREILEKSIDEETGEILDMGDELDALQMSREEKIENTALYIKHLEALAASIKAEEDALAARRKARENRAERLRDYLLYALGGEKWESAKVSISYRGSSAVVVNEEKLPEEYFKTTTKTETKPDKKLLKKALDAGETIPGAYIEQRKKVVIE